MFTVAGALLGLVVGFIGWAPARVINERTYVSTGLGLLIGAALGRTVGSWIRRRSDRSRGAS